MSVQQVSWVEKYRPQSLDDVVGHEPIVERMKSWVDDPEMPHVLLAGPAGTGKTTLVTAFAREKYGEDAWRNNVLEMNASDDRGIEAVRERVKSFARTSAVGDHQYSIVFLDEVDSMTDDAQAALRRVMEDFSDTTRFFLSCNYKSQIIDPIQSRCTPMAMGGLEDEEIKEIVRDVALREGIDVDDEEALDLIVNDCRGDARKAITRLQTASLNGSLTEESTKTFVDVVDYGLVNDIISEAAGGDLDSAMERLDREVLKEGVSPQKFVETALWIVQDMDIPEDSKAKIMDHLGEVDRAINQGGNPHVQIHSWLAKVMVARHLSLPNYDE